MPTETVYGLAARAGDPRAVEAVYRVKDRPRTKALPVQVATLAQVEALCVIPAAYLPALDRLWPGPLTAVLHGRSGGVSVGVRVPAHAVAAAVLLQMGEPLVVTSANRSGGFPAVEAGAAAASLLGEVDCVLDAGALGGGIASTVLDLTRMPPAIARRGPLGREVLAAALGCDVIDEAGEDG